MACEPHLNSKIYLQPCCSSCAQLHSVNLYVTRKDHGLANSNKLSMSRHSLPVGLVDTWRAI
jgi:hypothetical protein